MREAIIFNCHFNGLSIIQELGKNGICCIAMDSRRSIGTYSKYAKYVKCPDPLYEEKLFIDFLYEYCKKKGIKPILFPTNDHWAVAVSKYKEKLLEVSIPCVADWGTMQLLINKQKFYEIGQKKGYLTPHIWNMEQLEQLREDDYPIAVKPVIRRISSDNKSLIHKNLDRLRFKRIDNKEDLKHFIDKEKEFTDYLVFQEYVSGMSDNMYTIGVYSDQNSNILGIFSGRKVRGYPADIGDCVVGETCSAPPLLIENTERIVRELNYKGIAEFEYKKDQKTGEFKLIEVNPRSWSWIGITPYTGVSLPLIAYKDLNGDSTEYAESITNMNIRYVKILQDMLNCFILYRFNYPVWAKNYFEWKKDFEGNKVVFAEFNSKDWLVSVMSMLDLTVQSFKWVIKKSLKIFRG